MTERDAFPLSGWEKKGIFIAKPGTASLRSPGTGKAVKRGSACRFLTVAVPLDRDYASAVGWNGQGGSATPLQATSWRVRFLSHEYTRMHTDRIVSSYLCSRLRAQAHACLRPRTQAY